MTQLLEQALAQLQKLPESEQNAIATMILAELADEQQWDDAFAKSQGQLSKLADRVRQDIARGKVHDTGIDEL